MLLKVDPIRRKSRSVLCFVLCLIMTLSLLPVPAFVTIAAGDLTTEQPVIVVTGEALTGGSYTEQNISSERSYTLNELQALNALTSVRLYSAINRVGTMQIYRGEGVDLAGLLALSGFTGSSVDVAASDGFKRNIDLSTTRSYYPGVAGGNAGGAEAVRAMLMWLSARAEAPVVPGAAEMAQQALQLIIGQENVTDVNNSLFVSNAQRLIAGSDIEETPVSVFGKEFTRAEILLMPRAERTYSIETQLGMRDDRVRGVPLAVLLEEIEDSASVDFTTADSFNVSLSGSTKSELIAKNAILVYESYENSAWKGMYREGRSSGSGVGYFSLYADGERPSHMINTIGSGGVAFTDLTGYDWAVPAIEALAEAGVVNGVGGDRFDPGGSLTRAMVITMLGRALNNDTGLPEIGGRRFSDVNYNSWYGSFMWWAVQNRLIFGYGDGRFGPNDPLTVRDMLAIADRGGLSKPPDGIETSAANRPATRAEAAVVVHAMMLEGIDLSLSSTLTQYKHISYEGAPYNIDAVTGATLTIEGPGVEMSVPNTVRELEATVDVNTHRGVYTDGRGARSYEGVRVLALLDGYINENIELLDDGVEIVFKNRWRQDVGRLTYAQLKAADSGNSPVILAYGTADSNEADIRPFVFDGAAGESRSLGNGDGPLKLVYDMRMPGELPGSGSFASIAYLYIEEHGGRPGFKHITANDPAYNNVANTEHLITFTGAALGREITLSVRELQEMVEYDTSADRPASGGLGHRDEYSLSNTTYWYVNEYEGIKLWDLLLRMGVPESRAADDDTLISFSSWDNYRITTQFTFKQLADPELFYFYEKSPLDIGTDRPSKAELAKPEYRPDNQGTGWTTDANGYPVKKGYPVLLAYGLNGYPYVRDSNLPGFRTGLRNEGGPMRLIYGKTDGLNRGNPDAPENYAYFFNNGSQQLQRVQEIYVGDEIRYSTHLENPGQAYQALKDQRALTVEIVSAGVRTAHHFTPAELQNIIYGVDKRTRDGDGSQEKGYYFHSTESGGAGVQDLFEGINLEYLLTEHIGLQGTLGTVELYSGNATSPAAKYDLRTVGDRGFNSKLGTGGLGKMIAYAKNGYPLVAGEASAGFVRNDPHLAGRTILNSGGPLMFVRGQTEAERGADRIETAGENKTTVLNLTRIVVNLEPDVFAHSGSAHAAAAAQTVTFSGAIAHESGRGITVGTLETMQRYMVTGSYTVGGETRYYRGLDLLGLLGDRAIGASGLMSEVTVRGVGGGEVKLSLDRLRQAEAAGKPVLLAYGSATGGTPGYTGAAPLVAPAGPMRLVIHGGIAAECVMNVSGVAVTASELDGWKHNTGVYTAYAGRTLEISGQNLTGNRTLTVAQIEAMDNLFVYDRYSVGANTNWIQGIDLYGLLRSIGFAGDLSTSEFTAIASDGYSMQFTGSQLADGVNGKPIVVAFGQGTTQANGLPLVPNSSDAGYSAAAFNDGGPLRLMVHDNSGWSIKWLSKIVVGAAGGSEAPTETVEAFTAFPGGGAGGFPEAGVRSVAFDSSGGVWAGTFGGGLANKPAASDRFNVFGTGSSPALFSPFTSGVAVDASGGVWFTQNHSVTEPDGNRGVGYLKDGRITWYRAPATVADDYVQAIEIDTAGNVWFGSAGGLSRFTPGTNTWRSWTASDGLPAVSVNTVVADGRGGVWVGCYPDGAGTAESPFSGGYAYVSAAGTVDFVQSYTAVGANMGDAWARGIAADKDGGAWIVRSAPGLGTVGGRVDFVSPDRSSVRSWTGYEMLGAASMSGTQEIRAVAVDRNGGLWFGTSGIGVFHCTAPGVVKTVYSAAAGAWPADTPMDNIFALRFNGDILYVGSAGGIAWRNIVS